MSLREKLQRIPERPWLLWLLLWLGVIVLYAPAWKGGFQQDFQGWLQLYHHSSFWGMLNREGIPVHSFYQVTQLQLYLLTKLFGIHPIPWFLLFTALHALNGTLLYRVTRGILSDFQLANGEWVALAGTLLVLFNPSMTEVVIWKAAYHYLIAVQGILWILIWSRKYLLTRASKWVWRSLLLLAILAFTLELWYTIPPLVGLMILAYYRTGIIQKEQFKACLTWLFLPLAAILLVHLLLYRLAYGTWFAHTAFTSPGDDSLIYVAARLWDYEWHLLGFGRFFPHELRELVYKKTGYTKGGLFAIGLFAILAEWSWRSYPRWKGGMRAIALFGGWSLIGIVIILHYLPADLFLVNNDRYLYLAAFFQWMLVAIVIGVFFRNRWLRSAVFAVVLAVCLGFTAYLVREWRRSTKVFWAVQDKFRWNDAPLVLILNMPSMYNGIGIIRGNDTSELPNHLYNWGRPVPKGQVRDVSSYNMNHSWDGAHVVVEDSTHLHVTLNQWGSWWQLAGLGALNRSNEFFDLHFIDPGHDYRLTLKQRLPGMVILYQQGLEWRIVDMNRIGVEQW
jgi:hypothetical protein